MRRLPPLAAIRAFEAAARTENFTAAAAELGMTQAAVSYQVKSLEERLGAPLFIRENGRARMTQLGSRLLTSMTSAFDTIEEAIWVAFGMGYSVPCSAEFGRRGAYFEIDGAERPDEQCPFNLPRVSVDISVGEDGGFYERSSMLQPGNQCSSAVPMMPPPMP